MSEPAVFALIRDGETRFFADRWAGALLCREVMWGPQDFEAWILQHQPLDEWDDECIGGALIDFDRKLCLWSGDLSNYSVPRVSAAYHKLLEAAWPEFEVRHAAKGIRELTEHLGRKPSFEDDEYDEEEDEDVRPRTVAEATGRYDDEDDEDFDDEDFDDDGDDDEVRAWVTIVDAERRMRQRRLDQLPLDLLKAKSEAITAVAKLPPAEIPSEALVSEGLWVDESKKIARVWGSPALFETMQGLAKNWKGWEFKWSRNGYRDQCQASGTEGVPMSDAEALAKVLPLILSTQQFNLQSMLGALGGGLKKTAAKATGCLLVLICLPLLVFGAFSGNWTAVLIAIVATTVVVVGLFKLIEYRFTRAVKKNMPRSGDDQESPGVAGPQDKEERRQRINALLVAASMPPLAEVEPLFSDASGLELLAG